MVSFKIVALENTEISKFDYVLSKTDLVRLPFSLKSVLGQDYDTTILFPLPPKKINTYAEIADQSAIEFARKHTMYAETQKILIQGKFAWLPACVDPFLEKESLKTAGYYLTALFDHDDRIDLRESTLADLKLTNARITAVLSGELPTETDAPRVRAMAEIYNTMLKPLREKGVDYTFFTKTLQDYLNATEVEEKIHQKGKINEQFYIENRQHTGGAGNAFALICLLNEINVPKLMKEHVELTYMLRLVVDSVGFLNDVYSLPKEIKEIQKQIKGYGGNPEDPEEIKKHVTSNIVLLKWRAGCKMDEAIDKGKQLYEEKITGFFDALDNLKEELPTNTDLCKIVFALEGWLFGHPAWALGSGRYNPESQLTLPEYSAFLERIRAL